VAKRCGEKVDRGGGRKKFFSQWRKCSGKHARIFYRSKARKNGERMRREEKIWVLGLKNKNVIFPKI